MLVFCSIPSTSGTMSGEGILHPRSKCMVHHLISKREQELKKKKNAHPLDNLLLLICSFGSNKLNKAIRLIISKTLKRNGMFRAQSRLKT